MLGVLTTPGMEDLALSIVALQRDGEVDGLVGDLDDLQPSRHRRLRHLIRRVRTPRLHHHNWLLQPETTTSTGDNYFNRSDGTGWMRLSKIFNRKKQQQLLKV